MDRRLVLLQDPNGFVQIVGDAAAKVVQQQPAEEFLELACGRIDQNVFAFVQWEPGCLRT